MRTINEVIVHCTATKPEQDIGVANVREWHLARGWSDVGYHWVIRRDGTVEKGRPEKSIGAHARGRNQHSIGVALVGGINAKALPDCNFTLKQWRSLDTVLQGIRERHGGVPVIGHRDIEGVQKACPCFDATVL